MSQNKKDEALQGNEIIEERIAAFNKEATEENLAALLTQIRKRMIEKGQFVVMVEPQITGGLALKARPIKGQGNWFVAFTDFEQQMKGDDKVMSTFMADIEGLIRMATSDESVQGIVLNPWENPIMLNKVLLQVVLGDDGNAPS